MTWPGAGVTVREQILDNIDTVLAGIVTPTYATTVRQVRRWNENVLQNLTTFPLVVVVPFAESINQAEVSPLMVHDLEIGLVLAVRGSDWQDQLDKLAADVRVALMTDWTRGGKAENTILQSCTFYEPNKDSPVAQAQVDLRVRFRTLFSDPASAQ